MIRVFSIECDGESTLKCDLIADGQQRELIVKVFNDGGLQYMQFMVPDPVEHRNLSLRPETKSFLRVLWDAYNGKPMEFPIDIVP